MQEKQSSVDEDEEPNPEEIKSEDRDSIDSDEYRTINGNPFKRIFAKMRERPSPPIQKQNATGSFRREIPAIARTTNDLSPSSSSGRDNRTSPSPLPPPVIRQRCLRKEHPFRYFINSYHDSIGIIRK